MQTVGSTEEETQQNIFYVDLGSNSMVSTIMLLQCYECTGWTATKVTVKITDIAPTSANYNQDVISHDCGDGSSSSYVFPNAVLTCGTGAYGRYIVIQKYEVSSELIEIARIAAWTNVSLANTVSSIELQDVELVLGGSNDAVFRTAENNN